MLDKCVKKVLALVIILLFIFVSCTSAISVDTKTSVINNQNEKNKSFVDPNIHLKRINLPVLKRSLSYFRNSDFYDVEIGKVMEQIIKLIEFKGSVNSEDVENILEDNKITSFDVFAFRRIEGASANGYAYTFPFFLIQLLIYLIFAQNSFIGIGGLLHWYAESGYISYINISVGFKTYTFSHEGTAFGFFGYGYVQWYYWGDRAFLINGFALLIFVEW